jgi:hypothetical protein
MCVYECGRQVRSVVQTYQVPAAVCMCAAHHSLRAGACNRCGDRLIDHQRKRMPAITITLPYVVLPYLSSIIDVLFACWAPFLDDGQ